MQSANFEPLLLLYIVPVVALWVILWWRRKIKSIKAEAVLADAIEAGLHEPNSLHPVIDPALCLGCGSCAIACPEGDILGIIDGKAKLIEPSHCVGHGACQASCPTDAISLVFGTESRGVDIPMLTPQFETNVPDLYIAGELGGMGLIRNAVEQGRQAIVGITARVKKSQGTNPLDVLIIGAGPAGISASLAAMEAKLAFKTVEQGTIGGTTAHYPRGKLVMTKPAKLPIVGDMASGEVSKEQLVAFWEETIARTGLQVAEEEGVTKLAHNGVGFTITTNKGQYRATCVLLAIGRRGTPRTLGVPGEEASKVVYRMIDAEQYEGQHVLIVGGGDSALEAATAIAEQPGTTATLSYRSAAFSRARAKNRERLDTAVAEGRLKLMLESQVEAITADKVALRTKNGPIIMANDAVIVCAGGILPTQFLAEAGVQVETKFGTA